MKRTAYLLLTLVMVFIAAQSYASIQLNTLPLTKFVRSTGEPKTETKTFSGIGGPARIKLINGDLTDTTVERVSSSEIKVNGIFVFGPSDFNQKVSALEKDINLNDGSNTLSVLLKGKPGGTVSIQIIQILDNLEISPSEIILKGTGATAQITVTGELSNGRVVDITNSSYGTTCSSNNPYVAAVSTSGLVTAISGGETNILVTNGQYMANIPAKVEVMQSTQTVGPGGGTLEFHNGMVLEIPAGAVDTEVDITIKDLSYAEVDSVLQSYGLTPKYLAGGFEGKPDGLIFNVPIIATIPVGPREDSGDLPLLFAVDMGELTYTLANTQLLYDPVTSTVSVEIPHFTKWAVAFAEHIIATVDCNSPDFSVRCRCLWVQVGEVSEDIDVVVSGITECYRKTAIGSADFVSCIPSIPPEVWDFREWENPKITFTPPSPIKLHPPQTVSVTATVANAEGTVIPGASVSWENPQFETVSINPTSGKTISIKAEHAGTAHVWAKTGCNYQDQIIVEVTEIVDKLEVQAVPMIPPFNYPIQLNVVARNPQGHVIQIDGQYVKWSSNRPSPQPANFSSISGLSNTLTVSELGDIRVYATYDRSGEPEVRGYVDLCVHKRIASIEISPSSSTLYVGQTLLFDSVIPKAADGSSDLGCDFNPALTWGSTKPLVASVNSYGRVTANAVGQTTISATVTNGSAHGEASICVRPPIATIDVSPSNTTVFVGNTVPLTATAKTESGSTDFGCNFSPTFRWYSSNENVATVDQVGDQGVTEHRNVRAVSKGGANISVVYGSVPPAYATINVFDMTGTWYHHEIPGFEFSNCPKSYESAICTVTQTGNSLTNSCGAGYTGFFTGPTFYWTLMGGYWLYPNVWVISSTQQGSVSEDGLHYSVWDSWSVDWSYVDENGNEIWQYCSGNTLAAGDRL